MINPEDYDFGVPGERAPEPEDAFTPASITQNFQAFADLVCLLLQKYGCQFDVTMDELATTRGWSIQMLHNPRQKKIRLEAHHNDNPWDRQTPGVEPGHA